MGPHVLGQSEDVRLAVIEVTRFSKSNVVRIVM
jgi:hypothetical protein